ncbi:hypothetical protein [Mesorhizobium sp. C416B]|uniref:hypothetical protein n=1 Tax=Mesorhizobium sp. C416B TaxID=2956834 RepID=UPI003369CD8D
MDVFLVDRARSQPHNRELLAFRDEIQEKIDHWHRRNGPPADLAKYRDFLAEIGYLVPEGPDFRVSTTNVGPEIDRLGAQIPRRERSA